MSGPYTVSINSISVSLQNVAVFESIQPAIMEQQLRPVGSFLFPKPLFKVTRLEPNSEYKMSLRFDKVSAKKLRYRDGEFVETENFSKAPLKKEIHNHEEGVKKGRYWMKEPVEFDVRVSNKPTLEKTIFVETLCKYQIVLLISKLVRNDQGMYNVHGLPLEFTFRCLQFIPVTKYFNRKVADVKSALNPRSSRDSKRANAAKLRSLKTPTVVSGTNQSLNNNMFPIHPSVPSTDNQQVIMPSSSGSKVSTTNWHPLSSQTITSRIPAYTPISYQHVTTPMTNPSQTWTPSGNLQNAPNTYGMMNPHPTIPVTPMASFTSTTPMTNPNQVPTGYFPPAHDGYMAYHRNYHPSYDYQPAQPVANMPPQHPHPTMQIHHTHQNTFDQNYPNHYPHFYQHF